MNPVKAYLRDIERQLATGMATEHTHRAALQALVESFKKGVTATNEPTRSACGAPDYIVTDAVVRKLSPSARRSVSVVAVALSLLYVGFVLTGATQYVAKMMDVGIEFDDMPIERWKGLIIMPIGYALMGFRFLQILFNLITGKTDSLHLADEAADAMKLKTEGDAA